MPVLKTISPNCSPSAPKPTPCSTVPSSRTSTACCRVISGELSVENGGGTAQEGRHHAAGPRHPGERGVASLGRADRAHLLGRGRRVVQGEVGGGADGELRAVAGQPADPG